MELFLNYTSISEIRIGHSFLSKHWANLARILHAEFQQKTMRILYVELLQNWACGFALEFAGGCGGVPFNPISSTLKLQW